MGFPAKVAVVSLVLFPPRSDSAEANRVVSPTQTLTLPDGDCEVLLLSGAFPPTVSQRRGISASDLQPAEAFLSVHLREATSASDDHGEPLSPSGG